MLRKEIMKSKVWKVLVLAGLIIGYAEYELSGQKKLQQEQGSGVNSEANLGKSDTENTTGPEILLRSIFNLFDN
jgi:hypothetical protein